MRVHSAVGLITNSSSETYSVRVDDLEGIVKGIVTKMLELFGLEGALGDIKVEVLGHDDWLYDVAGDVFQKMIDEEPDLFEGIRPVSWQGDILDRPWEKYDWEYIKEGHPLFDAFTERYEAESKNFVSVNQGWGGEECATTLYSDIRITTAEGREIQADQIPGLMDAIAKEIF